MKNKIQYKLGVLVLLILGLILPEVSHAQTTDDTGSIEPPIDGKAIFYASVFVSDDDEGGTIDALIGLSQGEISGYGSFSAIVRWNGIAGGAIDSYDDEDYSSDPAQVPVLISFGAKYEVWFDVDVTAGTYTPYVQTGDMTAPVPILTDATFRNKGVNRLDTWTATHQAGGDDGLDILTVGIVDNVGDKPSAFNEAGIEAVTFQPAGLVGVWNPDTETYEAVFPFGTTSVNVTAEPVEHGTYISGTGTLDVSSGSGTLDLVATSESGETTKSYTVNWTVNDPQKDATLSGISLSIGDLSPAFGSTVKMYNVELPFATKEVEVTATASAGSEGATLTGDGVVTMTDGVGTATITVTSADQSVIENYVINFKNEAFVLTGVTVISQNYQGNDVRTDFGLFPDGPSDYEKFLPLGAIAISEIRATSNDTSATVVITPKEVWDGQHAVYEIRLSAGDFSESLIYTIDFKLATAGATATRMGMFEPALKATHVVYSKISMSDTGEPIDGLFSLSGAGPVTSYDQTSTGIRFEAGTGIVQVRNGTEYLPIPGVTSAVDTVTVSYDVVYHCWTEVDVPSGTYNLYVQKGEEPRTQIGENAAFRYVTDSLDSWGAYRNGARAFSELNVRAVALVDHVGDVPQTGSNVSSLSDITLSDGVLSPAFDEATTAYEVTLPSGLAGVEVEGVATDEWAFVQGDGFTALDSLGDAEAAITVISQDERDTTVYTVSFSSDTVTRDAYLAGLTVSAGAFSPAFTGARLTYTLDVPFGTDSVYFTATPNVTDASVAGDLAVSVADGQTVNITVNSSDQSTTNIYEITISVASASNDASLYTLGASVGAYAQEFDPAVTSYDLAVPFGTTSVDILSIPNHPGAKTNVVSVDLTGKTAESATVTVTAEDGSTKDYSIAIAVNEASSDATLSAISVGAGTLSPVFDAATESYTLDVPYGTSMVNVSGVGNHPGAVVTGGGDIDVSAGTATASILVTAEDETTKTYTVAITVLPGSVDADLLAITVANGTLTPAFDPGVFEYDAVVPLGTETAEVLAVRSDEKAKLTGGGAIDVITGSAVAELVVVSEDGSVTKTYRVNIYVGALPPPSLSIVAGVELSVYPNPVVNSLVIDLKKQLKKEVSFTMLDVQGKVLRHGKLLRGVNAIDVRNLSKGLYLVKIESGDESFIQRMIK